MQKHIKVQVCIVKNMKISKRKLSSANGNFIKDTQARKYFHTHFYFVTYLFIKGQRKKQNSNYKKSELTINFNFCYKKLPRLRA